MLLFLFQSKFFLSNFMCPMHWGRRTIIVLLFLMPSQMVCLHGNVVYDVVHSLEMFLHLFTRFVWVLVWIWVSQPACGSQSNLGEFLLSFRSVVLGMKLRWSGSEVSALTSALTHPPALSSSLHSLLSSVRIFFMQDKWVLEMPLHHSAHCSDSAFSAWGFLKMGLL